MGINFKKFNEDLLFKDTWRSKLFLLRRKLTPMWWHNLRNGLWALWKWKGAVWDYRPWDFNYTLRMLRHSLHLQATSIEKNARHVGYEANVTDLREVIEALDRLNKDDYLTHAINASPMAKEINVMLGTLDDKKWNGPVGDAFSEAGVHSDEMEKADVELVFTKMKNEYNHWWD